MKIRLLNAGLCACALLMTLSGCSSDETLTGDNSTAVQSMKINVSDGMFTSVDNNGAKTRATDNGATTSFAKDDAVGIFVVKSDGTLALTNAKYTYDGISKWLNSNSTENLPYYEGAKYFAYYPYQESLASSKYDATKTTAETFFGTLISSWTPATDQSTQANYTAQDLMVSMATVNATTHAASFAMSHQMAFVEMDLPQYHYTYNGADTYRFTFDNANKPFNTAAGKYRFLVKPSSTLSITGNNQYNSTDVSKTKRWQITGTAPVVAKYKIYKYKGASAFLSETKRDFCFGTANIGDYLYSDGTTGTTKDGKTVVGIVFSNQLSSAEYTKGYTHGYALALQDVSTSTMKYKATNSDAGLTKVQTFSAYYNDINAGYYGTFTLHYDKSNATYPAWQAANNYNVNVSGFTNSGWYLPSMGQWWDVCANLGSVDLRTEQASTTSAGNIYTGGKATTNVNNAIKAAGGTALNTNDYYWSASEYYSSDAVNVRFYSNVRVDSSGKTYTSCVRAVLAF
jgi:hypothetical protein